MSNVVLSPGRIVSVDASSVRSVTSYILNTYIEMGVVNLFKLDENEIKWAHPYN